MIGPLTFQISREICSSMKAVHSHTSTKDFPYVWTRNASKLHLVNVFRLFERAFGRIRAQHHFTNVSKSNIQSIRKICRCNFWSLLSTKSDSGFHEPLNTLFRGYLFLFVFTVISRYISNPNLSRTTTELHDIIINMSSGKSFGRDCSVDQSRIRR